MCEIQFCKRIDNKNLDDADIIKFIEFMSVGDIKNNHSFGFFNGSNIFKKEGKFDYRKIDDNIIKSDNFIVGHNRRATKSYFVELEEQTLPSNKKKESSNDNETKLFFCNSSWINNYGFYPNSPFFVGIPYYFRTIKNKSKKENKNNNVTNKTSSIEQKKRYPESQNHPFLLEDFVLVHNGVVWNYDILKSKYKLKSNIFTDSYIILFLINKFFKEINDTKISRRDRIIKSIDKAINLIVGNFSIFLYDKVSKELFYFKNAFTDFGFIVYDKLLIGTTDKRNFKYVLNLKGVLDNKFKKLFSKIFNNKNNQNIFIPKSKRIYLIKDYYQPGDKLIEEVYNFELKEKKNHTLKKGKIKMKGGRK